MKKKTYKNLTMELRKIEKTYIQFLGTLANQNRIKIILALKNGPKNVGEIVDILKMNQTTVSHNLKRLKLCGFVNLIPKGKFREYSINEETIKPLLEIMERHMNKYCVHLIKDKKVPDKYKTRRL